MNVYAISDLHGNLPEPPADAELLLLAGDICPDFRPYGMRPNADFYDIDKGGIQQAKWLENQFKPWLTEHDIPTVGIWGNHDFVGEKKFLVPRDLPWTYLQDSDAFVQQRPATVLRVWGTPWVPGLPYWAFYGRQEALQGRSDLIPEGLDVLMTHGPPRCYGDYIPTSQKQRNKYNNFGGEHVGDLTLNGAILRAKPKVVICGHIHEARGCYDLDGIPIYNVAAVDENYVLHENPWTRLYEFGSA